MQLECKMAAYSNHASASRTVIDYTTASSSAKSVAAAKAASDSNLKRDSHLSRILLLKYQILLHI